MNGDTDRPSSPPPSVPPPPQVTDLDDNKSVDEGDTQPDANHSSPDTISATEAGDNRPAKLDINAASVSADAAADVTMNGGEEIGADDVNIAVPPVPASPVTPGGNDKVIIQALSSCIKLSYHRLM